MEKFEIPLVSVIMPAYNSGQLIRRSIQSVIGQTYKRWELIVINDGSKDNTAEIVSEMAAVDPRIKLITQKNGGIGRSRNSGYNHASGEWLAYLDHDDLWTPDKLEKQMHVAGQNPSYDVLFCGGWFFYIDDLTNLVDYKTIYGEFSAERMFLRQLEENYIPTLAVVVKKSILEKIGPWDESKAIQGCDDYDYWFRMAQVNATFYGLNDKLFYYRKHGSNYSNDVSKMLTAEAHVLLKDYDRAILNDGAKTRLYKKKLHSILLALFRNGETSKVKTLLKDLYSLLPSPMLKAALTTLKYSDSYMPLKAFLKLDRVLNTN